MRYTLLLLIALTTSSPLQAQGTWEHITEINGYDLGYVSNIFNDGNGSMWVDDGNVFRFRDNAWETYTDTLSSFYDCAASANGDCWFSYSKSIVRYDGTTFETFYPDTLSLQTSVSMGKIAVQSDGVVWVTNSGNGLLRFDGTEWSQFTTEDGLVSNSFFDIAVSPDDELWVCYGTPIVIEYGFPCYGVSNFDGEVWHTYNTETEGINSNRVMGIAFDTDGNVFISYVYGILGNLGGISKFNGSSWEWLTDDYWGFQLTIDAFGKIWFYHDTDTYDETEYGFYDGSTWTSFVESSLFAGPSFDVDNNAWFLSLDGIFILTPDATAVENPENQPHAIELYPNYPNPFNPETTILFNLQVASQATLSVYSMTGQKVATLADGMLDAGRHSVVFDGAGYASGRYVYRLETDYSVEAGSMLLVK